MEDKTNIKVYAFNSNTRSFEPTEQKQNSSVPPLNQKLADSDSSSNSSLGNREEVKHSLFSKTKKGDKILFLWCKLLQKLDQKLYPKQIARQFNMSQQIVDYHVKNMKAEGLITQEIKSNITSYIITESGREFLKENRGKQRFSLRVSEARESQEINTTNHNLRYRLTILHDNPAADFKSEKRYRETRKRNWTAKSFIVTTPLGMTIEKTSRSVIIYFHEFSTAPDKMMCDFIEKVHSGFSFIYNYLLTKYDIKVDIISPKPLNWHTADENTGLDNMFEKRASVEVNLGRKANVIWPADFDAKAWADFSNGLHIEANDLTWKQRFLRMPETVARLEKVVFELTRSHVELSRAAVSQGDAFNTQNTLLMPIIDKFGVQLALHLDVIGKMSAAMQNIEKHVEMQSAELIKARASQNYNGETVVKLPTAPDFPHAESVVKLRGDAIKTKKQYVATKKKQHQGVVKLNGVVKLPTAPDFPHAESVVKLRGDAIKTKKQYVATKKKQHQGVVKLNGVVKLKHAGGRPRAEINGAELARIRELHPDYGIRRLARRLHTSKDAIDNYLKRSQPSDTSLSYGRLNDSSNIFTGKQTESDIQR